MGDAPSVLVLGLVVGLQSSLLAIGLVLIYRANRFINFAQGQMGAVAAAALAMLVLQHDVPYWVALAAALALGAATAAGIERLLRWRLAGASRLTLLVATIGISQLALLAVLVGPLRGDPSRLNLEGYPQPFDLRWTVGSLVLNSSQVTTIVCAPLIALGVLLFLNRTRTGRAIRGAASNPDAARLAGVSVRRVSLIVWVIAGLVSSLAAILYAPSQPAVTFAAASGLGLLLRGLAAAMLAGMVDLRIAFAAGIGLGVVEQAAIFYFTVPGLPDLSIFVVLVVGILLRGQVLGRTARVDDNLTVETSESPVPERVRQLLVVRRSGMIGWWGLAALLAVLPLLPGLQTQERAVFLLFIVSYAIAGLGLTVLTGWAGQVSLGHFAFVGVGAFAAAAVARHNPSIPLMLMVAGAMAALASVIVGFVAVRLRGLFLGVVTLGFAFIAQSWLFRQSWVIDDPGSIARIEDPHLFGIEFASVRGAYVVGVVVLLAAVLGLGSLRRSAIGRALIAVRDNQDLASSYGMTPTVVKLTALAVSGFLCGLAGTLWGMAQGTWTFSAFDPTMSFVLLAIVIVGGMGTLHGPVLGAFAVFAWPYLVPEANTLAVRSFTSGLLLLVVLLFLPGGIAGLLASARRRLWEGLAETAPEPFVPDEEARPLDVQGVSVSFGGIEALRDVSIHVEQGEIVGLIGGNGAGKSTLLSCISGHLQPSAGKIVVRGQDVSGLAPEFRLPLGLARTFQDAHLFPGLTVLETLMAAMDHRDRSGTVGSLLGAPWVRAAEATKRRRAMEILDSFGLADRADSLTSELSTGMRRVCDLTAIVASGAELVLLDEPTAGLAQREVEAFAPLLRSLRDERGCSMVVIEHDMAMMMSLCDRIYCLEQGELIAMGTPDEVRHDPRVIASYLGSDGVAVERSGRRAGAGGAPSTAAEAGAASPRAQRPRRPRRRAEPLTAAARGGDAGPRSDR
jgi:ABC-type branched-subunit amino acid transport system ATPase component/ABC-type branched-subunit amino acid transport system permease subunit